MASEETEAQTKRTLTSKDRPKAKDKRQMCYKTKKIFFSLTCSTSAGNERGVVVTLIRLRL
jgi:hypothetical protein